MLQGSDEKDGSAGPRIVDNQGMSARIDDIEMASGDATLRAALRRESAERHRAECLARIQADVVQLALNLLVREPDIEGFFGALTKALVHADDSYASCVWLLDDAQQRSEFWMAYVKGQPLRTRNGDADGLDECATEFPCVSMAEHLHRFTAGWTRTTEYEGDDARLPEPVRAFNVSHGVAIAIVTPLLLGGRTLGWMTLSGPQPADGEGRFWRVVLLEAIARQATLALHQSRLAEAARVEARRQAILEERNRLARDIHDKLAQGFAAILMQLQGAQREACGTMSPSVAAKLETAVDLARTHLTEARRSVGALRPAVGHGEDLAEALRRIADLAQRTTTVPIDINVEGLPRLVDGVQQEIVGIAQEALTNAVRHSRAARIRLTVSPVQSLGLRLSVADDGRGIPRERSNAGFGMTSMHERAERIGASLTIVTAPRSGTEVVLAWEPSALPAEVHVAG